MKKIMVMIEHCRKCPRCTYDWLCKEFGKDAIKSTPFSGIRPDCPLEDA